MIDCFEVEIGICAKYYFDRELFLASPYATISITFDVNDK